MQGFEIIQRLGEGSYSQVFKVVRKSDGQVYAMKKVKLFELKERERENALNEVRILASYNDPYIINYKDAFIEDNQLCIVMEFANGGDLQLKIKEAQKSGSLPEKDIWKALHQITRGLKRLHEMKVVHRDLKSANIFISNGIYKLGDLNVSKVTKKGLAYTQTGTPYYASPEVWRNQAYNTQSDIWSLGCVIYEMAALKLPFKGQDLNSLCAKVQRGLFEALPNRYSRDLQTIITQMLQVQPALRLTCASILGNPLMKQNYNDQQAGQQQLNQELLQTIVLSKNLKNLKLPKSNYQQQDLSFDEKKSYEESKLPRMQNQRAHSALPGQIRDKNPSPQSKRSELEQLQQYPSAPRRKIDPSTPVSQPTQQQAQGKQQMIQEQLKLELKKEQEKLRQKQPQQQIQQQNPSSHHSQRSLTPQNKQSALSQEQIRQQIVKKHKLDEIRSSEKKQSNKQEHIKQENPTTKHNSLKDQVTNSRQSLGEIDKKQYNTPEATKRIIVSAQPSQRQTTEPRLQAPQQQNEIPKQQPNKPQVQQKIASQQEDDQDLIVSGLQNLNPRSIQSILCQPVLQINENPFPAQAKVTRVASAKQETSKVSNHQHYFPVNEINDRVIKEMQRNQIK
ncbi:hypothetical protein pb186bvf_002599 [Paramecium bursaria]